MLELIAANLPILICFLLGIGCLIAEAFLPGFGVTGITGVVLEVITLVMTWFEHGPVATLIVLLIRNTATASSIARITPHNNVRILLKLERPATALLE